METSAGQFVPPLPAWWEDEAMLRRFICDLATAELRVLRPSARVRALSASAPSLQIPEALDADSLEMLALAGALAEAVHLHESGIEDYLLVQTTVGDWTSVVRAGLQRFSSAMSFRTSGSTGRSKRCTHPLALLWQEVMELGPRFPGRRRILSAVPSHHIYGFLFTVLLPRALSLPAGSVIDLRDSSPARLAHVLREGDLVIAHPEYWKLVAHTVPAIHRGVIGVTSSAPCPDETAAALVDAGLEKLVQVYGSSETAGVGWRERHSEPYRLLPYWRQCAPNTDSLLRAIPNGTQMHHECQDRLTWLDEHHFLPLGRRDAAVQVGGANVYPARVREILLGHPDVQDATVRLMRPDEGGRLKAFIVPCDPACDTALLHAELEAWGTAELGAAERPKAFSFGPQLPVNEQGKPADWGQGNGEARS